MSWPPPGQESPWKSATSCADARGRLTGRLRTRDLHVHSRFSTDSGNYALKRARLGESFTEPERIYGVARARGMDLVTISDHNTVEGALRIAHLEHTFLSVEVHGTPSELATRHAA